MYQNYLKSHDIVVVSVLSWCRTSRLGTRYLKSSGAAAYRYSNKKVAPLAQPLLAYKTAAADATLKK